MSLRIYKQPTASNVIISLPNSTPASGPENPASQFRDIHLYDYSYKDLDYTPLVTSDQRQWIEKLLPKMSNPIAIHGIHIILANIGNLNNFDTTNQKRAEDLLADLAYVILTKDTDLLPLLEEQLSDMYQLGQCAQGRVTRLWQLRQLV